MEVQRPRSFPCLKLLSTILTKVKVSTYNGDWVAIFEDEKVDFQFTFNTSAAEEGQYNIQVVVNDNPILYDTGRNITKNNFSNFKNNYYATFLMCHLSVLTAETLKSSLVRNKRR